MTKNKGWLIFIWLMMILDTFCFFWASDSSYRIRASLPSNGFTDVFYIQLFWMVISLLNIVMVCRLYYLQLMMKVIENERRAQIDRV